MESFLVHCEDCKIKSDAVNTLKKGELDYLSRHCSEVKLKKGEYVFKEGNSSSHIAYIRSGMVKIHMTGPAGRDQILKIAITGHYVGLQTILFENVHRYSASTLTETVFCFIDSISFQQLIKRNPGFGSEIIRMMGEDEYRYYERFVSQLQKHLNGRLVDALMYFYELEGSRKEFVLPVSKTDLAGLIGSSRESVSRALRELSDAGVLSYERNKIRIENLTMMKTISMKG